MTPTTEAALRALGPYSVTHGGHLLWDPAPGFAWPWGTANLGFAVRPRNATDADYLRLLDAWRQVCGRQSAVLATVRAAVLDSWRWAGADGDVFDSVRGGHFDLGTGGVGQVSIEAVVAVGWDEEHGVVVDLIPPDERPA